MSKEYETKDKVVEQLTGPLQLMGQTNRMYVCNAMYNIAQNALYTMHVGFQCLNAFVSFSIVIGFTTSVKTSAFKKLFSWSKSMRLFSRISMSS